MFDWGDGADFWRCGDEEMVLTKACRWYFLGLCFISDTLYVLSLALIICQIALHIAAQHALNTKFNGPGSMVK